MKLNYDFFKNFKLIGKISIIEKYFIGFIILLLIFSIFVGIPTDSVEIGISSPKLNIGDRAFYINESVKGFGYYNDSGISSTVFSGNILYPYILKLISFVAGLFNQDQYSKLWNFICIFISSSLSIINLHLLRISTANLFKKKVAEIACFIYIFNPYTYFYSLSGGITNYTLFGVTFILWIFTRSIKSGYKITESKKIANILLISIGTIYLSLLRPSGSIFSIIILVLLIYKIIKNSILNNKFKTKGFLKIALLTSSLIIVIYNFNYSLKYSILGIKSFANEGGLFFGYSRDLLRSKLIFDTSNFFYNFKNFVYFILWKITDFVSGISDIRDTHSATSFESIFPFVIRTFTGIFILFPTNLFSFLGLVINFKIILNNDMWIIILASLFAISPSLIGIAQSRYLIMFYTPFIIFAAKVIRDMFHNIEVDKLYE